MFVCKKEIKREEKFTLCEKVSNCRYKKKSGMDIPFRNIYRENFVNNEKIIISEQWRQF